MVTLICTRCGEEFEALHRNKKYCGSSRLKTGCGYAVKLEQLSKTRPVTPKKVKLPKARTYADYLKTDIRAGKTPYYFRVYLQ